MLTNCLWSLLLASTSSWTYSSSTPHLRKCLLIFLEEEEGTGRGERREQQKGVGERERHQYEKHQSVASHMCPDWGSNPKPRYVPWLEIQPSAFWCIGWSSDQVPTNWATQPGELKFIITLIRLKYNYVPTRLWTTQETELCLVCLEHPAQCPAHGRCLKYVP